MVSPWSSSKDPIIRRNFVQKTFDSLKSPTSDNLKALSGQIICLFFYVANKLFAHFSRFFAIWRSSLAANPHTFMVRSDPGNKRVCKCILCTIVVFWSDVACPHFQCGLVTISATNISFVGRHTATGPPTLPPMILLDRLSPLCSANQKTDLSDFFSSEYWKMKWHQDVWQCACFMFIIFIEAYLFQRKLLITIQWTRSRCFADLWCLKFWRDLKVNCI